VVPLTRRITKQDGSFGGILNMTVDPNLFTDPFAKTSMGPDATRAIMGRNGYTLLRLNGGNLVYGGDTRKSQLFTELKKAPVGCYTAVASSDGIRRSVCYRAIDPYDIIILSGSSVASIEEIAATKMRGYIWASTLVAILIVALSCLLIFGLLRQRKLIESQQSFNQLVEMVPQSIFRMNAQGNIVWANRRTVEYARPSEEELAQGFDWVVTAVHPEDRGRVQDFVSRALLKQSDMQSCEYRKRRFDGAYLWYSSQVTRLVGMDGGDDYFLFTGTDVHDRKMAEERARVAQKLESIGQLTGGMAHDFNNLLAIIVGNLDLMKPNVKVEVDSKRLDVAIGAAQRGVSLVKSLLALASKQPLLPATVDLWALIERISPLLRHALGQRIDFALKPPGANVYVEVDEAGLEAVLLNLIVNAKDAMPKGGDLTLGLNVSNGLAHIVVKDTGTGMPEAVRKRATEPFFTTKERGHGTGLGLSMVAGFAKQSSGTMKIESEEGKGTTIEITLPLANPLVASKVITAFAAVPIQRTAANGKLRILIVDDEPALAEIVREWARAEQHTAVLANSAQDALTLLGVRSFDVLLTDIIMPGESDGLGLAEKASVLYPTMKILLMSGFSRETANHRGDVPWPLLVKPFHREAFVAALA
jgi:PAS domain S-box-containing protein